MDASIDFYQELFDWDADEVPLRDGRSTLWLDDQPVAVVSPLTASEGNPRWLAYAHVPEVDTTVKALQLAGGTALSGTTGFAGLGRAVRFTDPGGAEFGACEPLEPFRGMAVGGPRSLCRVELNTRDLEGCESFYRSVFGWSGENRLVCGTGTVTELSVPGCEQPLGSFHLMNEVWPTKVPQHWMHYFGTTDVDALTARASRLGGSVCVAPVDVEGMGRLAVLADPHQAVFSVTDRGIRD
ncbi:VOC family protein [Streptomyces sp. NPDC056470]|uniref:VOC family protein n=1 Tax=Streptomyces sp. NPDC056470 TaxID=3345831 RepID=UPI003687F17D